MATKEVGTLGSTSDVIVKEASLELEPEVSIAAEKLKEAPLETAPAAAISLPVKFVEISASYRELSSSLELYLINNALNLDLTPHFREFCILLDKQMTAELKSDSEVFIFTKVLLGSIALGELKGNIESQDLEKAIRKLQHEICLSMAKKLKSNTGKVLAKKDKKLQITQAIQQFEAKFNNETHYLFWAAIERLISTNFESYYKPSKDPLKIKLFTALEFLCRQI